MHFKDSKGNLLKTVEANEGDDILAIAHEYDIDLEGATAFSFQGFDPFPDIAVSLLLAAHDPFPFLWTFTNPHASYLPFSYFKVLVKHLLPAPHVM